MASSKGSLNKFSWWSLVSLVEAEEETKLTRIILNRWLQTKTSSPLMETTEAHRSTIISDLTLLETMETPTLSLLSSSISTLLPLNTVTLTTNPWASTQWTMPTHSRSQSITQEDPTNRILIPLSSVILLRAIILLSRDLLTKATSNTSSKESSTTQASLTSSPTALNLTARPAVSTEAQNTAQLKILETREAISSTRIALKALWTRITTSTLKTLPRGRNNRLTWSAAEGDTTKRSHSINISTRPSTRRMVLETRALSRWAPQETKMTINTWYKEKKILGTLAKWVPLKTTLLRGMETRPKSRWAVTQMTNWSTPRLKIFKISWSKSSLETWLTRRTSPIGGQAKRAHPSLTARISMQDSIVEWTLSTRKK